MFEAYVQESRAGREQKDREEMEALRNEVGRGGVTGVEGTYTWWWWVLTHGGGGGYLHMVVVVGTYTWWWWWVLTHGGGG